MREGEEGGNGERLRWKREVEKKERVDSFGRWIEECRGERGALRD